MIRAIFKVIFGFVVMLLVLIILFFGSMLFTLMHEGTLFLDSEEVIYRNWEVKLPKGGEEIYYTDSGPSFQGDGQRYSVYKYKNEDNLENAFDWKNKKDNKIEEEILDVIQRLKESDKNIPKQYKFNLNKKYKYMKKTKDDNSDLYLIYIIEENKMYVIEDII